MTRCFVPAALPRAPRVNDGKHTTDIPHIAIDALGMTRVGRPSERAGYAASTGRITASLAVRQAQRHSPRRPNASAYRGNCSSRTRSINRRRRLRRRRSCQARTRCEALTA
jgi:hypothetical protein